MTENVSNIHEKKCIIKYPFLPNRFMNIHFMDMKILFLYVIDAVLIMFLFGVREIDCLCTYFTYVHLKLGRLQMDYLRKHPVWRDYMIAPFYWLD